MDKTAASSTMETSSPESSWRENTCPAPTKSKLYNARHTWTLPVSDLFYSDTDSYPRKVVYSQSFSATDETNITWKIILYREIKTSEIMMTLQPNPPKNVVAKYRIIVYGRSMDEVRVTSNLYHFSETCNEIFEVMSNICSDACTIVIGGELNFGCEVQYCHGIDNIAELICGPEIMNSKYHCSKILEPMFKNQKFSDVEINISGRTFEAHKGILASASSVFLAKFESGMTETEQNYINIDDIDEETFEELLRFIYTGKVNNIENVACTLFAAADKYAIDDLKNICQKELGESLTADNAVRILILADRHNAVELKEEVIEFMKIERVDVTKPEVFNLMIDSHRDLLAEVFRGVTKK